MGDGPTVMLLHGWGGTAADMLPAAAAFARAGHRAVVFDMPGHGRSPGRESSLVQFLRAIEAVCGCPRSAGDHRRTFVRRHSRGFWQSRSSRFLFVAQCSSLRRRGPPYYVERFSRTIGLPAERAVGMMRRVVERVGRPVESLDALVAARQVDVPALIFHDPADREVPFTFATQMAAALRGSRLVPAPALGHKRILRDAATVAGAVDFARSLGNRTVGVAASA